MPSRATVRELTRTDAGVIRRDSEVRASCRPAEVTDSVTALRPAIGAPKQQITEPVSVGRMVHRNRIPLTPRNLIEPLGPARKGTLDVQAPPRTPTQLACNATDSPGARPRMSTSTGESANGEGA